MMERYKGYWISGSALPGPPNTRYRELLGRVFKDGRLGSIVEIMRIQDNALRLTHRRPRRVLRMELSWGFCLGDLPLIRWIQNNLDSLMQVQDITYDSRF
jgi:hypothetical protein